MQVVRTSLLLRINALKHSMSKKWTTTTEEIGEVDIIHYSWSLSSCAVSSSRPRHIAISVTTWEEKIDTPQLVLSPWR
jgi:hypothetical protein